MQTKLEKPAWVKMRESELKDIISELAKKNSPSKIGIILRDQYGIPTTKVFGKKLKDYLKELGIEINENLENAKHRLQKAQSRLNITKKYFELSKSKK